MFFEMHKQSSNMEDRTNGNNFKRRDEFLEIQHEARKLQFGRSIKKRHRFGDSKYALVYDVIMVFGWIQDQKQSNPIKTGRGDRNQIRQLWYVRKFKMKLTESGEDKTNISNSN